MSGRVRDPVWEEGAESQLVQSRPRGACSCFGRQQQIEIVRHIHAQVQPAAQLARGLRAAVMEWRDEEITDAADQRCAARWCDDEKTRSCIQIMPEREGRRARSRFSSFFNVAAIGGKSPRASIGSHNVPTKGEPVKRFDADAPPPNGAAPSPSCGRPLPCTTHILRECFRRPPEWSRTRLRALPLPHRCFAAAERTTRARRRRR